MAQMAEIYPFQVLLATVSGWMNRRQGEILEYLIEENRVLKEQLKGKRLRLTDDQRRRLAAKGKRLGRRLLMQVATLARSGAGWTFDTGRPTSNIKRR